MKMSRLAARNTNNQKVKMSSISIDFSSLELTHGIDLHAEWAPVREAMAGSARLNTIIDDAIARGRRTSEYTRADLDLWANELAKKIGPGSWHGEASRGFRLVICQPNLKNMFPKFRHNSEQLAKNRECSCLTEELERDLWRFTKLRRRELLFSRIDPLRDTEIDRMQHLHQLCQYAAEQLHIWPLVMLDQVLTEPVVSSWVKWLHEEKHYKRTSLEKLLSSICTMLIKHPDYWNQDLDPIRRAARKVKDEPGSVKSARKSARMVNYKELLVAIRRMKEARLAAEGNGSEKQVAWLVHDQLLLMFLVLGLWPRQCVRGCRISGDNPNLFKGPLRPEDVPADLQPWASELLKENRELHLWQYRFTSKELPRRGAIHGVVHNFLLPLLEVYLDHYRDKLLKEGKSDPGTLFFNRFGNPLTENALVNLFGDLTRKYGDSGKRVLPFYVPRIFGNYWDRKYSGRHGELASILGLRVPAVRAWFKDETTSEGRAINNNQR